MADEFQSAQRISRLTPLADIHAAISAQVKRVPARWIATGEAVGLVLAEDIAAPRDHPEQNVALVDGLAIRADSTSDASAYAPIPLHGIPARVDAGDPLPAGTDAVAPLDAFQIDGGIVQAVAPVTAGDGVLSASLDAARGQIIGKKGQTIGPAQVAAMLACGIESVNVCRARILIARTSGNDRTAATFEMIEKILRMKGAEIIASSDLTSALERGDTDAVITIGGTGTGRSDNTVMALSKSCRLLAHGIGISPGETAALGFCGTRPILALPGRIDAALSAWLMLGRPLLDALTGSTHAPFTPSAKLTRKVTSTIGIADVVLVRRSEAEAEPLTSGHWPMHALAEADGWIAIPAQSEGYPAGSKVEVGDLP